MMANIKMIRSCQAICNTITEPNGEIVGGGGKMEGRWMLRMMGLAKSSLSIIDAHHKASHIELLWRPPLSPLLGKVE